MRASRISPRRQKECVREGPFWKRSWRCCRGGERLEQTTKASTKFATKVSSAPLKMSQIQCGAGKLRQPVASGLLTPWKKGEPASGHRDNKRSVRIIYCREVSAQGFSGLAESTFSGSGVLSLERLRYVAHAFQRAARMKTPNTKLQTPENSQAPNPNSTRDVAAWELVI